METDDTCPFDAIGIGQRLYESDRVVLFGLAVTVHYDPGELIFREREKHPFVYWVVEGQVSLEMATIGQTRQPLITLAVGDLLAWSALLTERRMTATAKATVPTRLFRFPTRELLELCSANHEIGYQVMQHIAAQLAQRLLATRLQMLDLFQPPSAIPTEGVQ